MAPARPPRRSWSARPLILLAGVVAVAGIAGCCGTDPPESRDAEAPPEPPATPRAVRQPVIRDAGIAGTVRDAGGEPLAGATVCAFARDEAVFHEPALADPLCTTSTEGGAYRLDGLPSMHHAVVAGAPRHIPAGISGPGDHNAVALHPAELRTGIDLSLAPGGVEITGTVQDPGGAPIAGAWVLSGAMDPRTGPSDRLAVARSDGDGRFTLWVGPGASRPVARAPGYARRPWGSTPHRDGPLVLIPESVLVGRVVEAGSGAPVAGARIRLDHLIAEDDLRRHGELPPGIHIPADTEFLEAGALTDADGRFRVGALPPGRYKPVALADGGYGEAEHAVVLGMGETSEDIVIAAHPAARIEGKVLYDRSKTPCSYGHVSIFGARLYDVVTLDEGGVARFPAAIPDTYEVTVVCPGAHLPPLLPAIEVRDADVVGLEWEVRPGRAIRGQVFAGRRPVAGFEVRALLRNGLDGPFVLSRGNDRTDAEGRFEIRGLAPGPHDVRVLVDGPTKPAHERLVEVPADHDLEGVRFSLPGQGKIQGIVVDDRGDPVEGVRVVARGESGTRGMRSAAGGGFEFEGLFSGKYDVYMQDDFLRRVENRPSKPVRVGAERVAKVRLHMPPLPPLPPRVEVRGRVVDPAGLPVRDAYVMPAPDELGPHEMPRSFAASWILPDPVPVDADGRFVLESRGSAPRRIRAFRRGGVSVLVEGVTPGSNVTITLSPSASIGGRLAGTPPEVFAVVVERKGVKNYVEEFLHTGGRWRIDGLSPGHYPLRILTPTGFASLEVDLMPGERREDLAIELTPAARLRGRAVDAAGQPVAGLQVEATCSWPHKLRDGRAQLLRTGADGRFEVGGLLPGNASVYLRSLDSRIDQDVQRAQKSVWLPAGEDMDLGDLTVEVSRLESLMGFTSWRRN